MAHSRIVIAVACLALVGCAQPPVPVETEPQASADGYKACLMSASEATRTALGDAAEELDITVATSDIADDTANASALQGFVDSGCNLIIGDGQAIADAIAGAADANPDVSFALVDATPSQTPVNLRPVVFNVHEAAYLAGYRAAGESDSGTVGTFGALNTPRITIYMDGFAQGVAQWNEAHPDDSVELVGWDLDSQRGTFVESTTEPYDDPKAGAEAASSLAKQGADVIFAVADASSKGVFDVDDVTAIWSGDDGCEAVPNHCSSIVASVVKDKARVIRELIAAQRRSEASGVFAANLRNEGVKLVSDTDATSVLQGEIDDLTSQIIDGKITVTSPSALS